MADVKVMVVVILVEVEQMDEVGNVDGGGVVVEKEVERVVEVVERVVVMR